MSEIHLDKAPAIGPGGARGSGPDIRPRPRGDVSLRRLLVWLLPVSTSMIAVFQGIQQVLIPGQIEAVNAGSKIANLALATAVSSVTAVAGLIAGGIISDRTTGRWGRRTPSLVIGALLSAILMVLMGRVISLGALVCLYALLWFTMNYFQGALTPMLPERVPRERRGVGSSVIALGMPVGIIVGVNFAAHVSPPLAYEGLAAFLALATLGLILFAPEHPVGPTTNTPANMPSGRQFGVGLATFFASFAKRDFSLAFVARALMFLSMFGVTGYTYYILQDHIGVGGLPHHDPKFAVSLLITVQMLLCTVSAALSGWISDRWQRPKLLVGISSVGMALALLIPVVSPDWTGMLLLQICIGLFFGAYLAIDLALMSLVLPDPAREGRDMAMLGVATAGPQILSPVIAAAIIAHLGYSALFLFGAITALAAGIAVFFIKRVR